MRCEKSFLSGASWLNGPGLMILHELGHAIPPGVRVSLCLLCLWLLWLLWLWKHSLTIQSAAFVRAVGNWTLFSGHFCFVVVFFLFSVILYLIFVPILSPCRLLAGVFGASESEVNAFVCVYAALQHPP